MHKLSTELSTLHTSLATTDKKMQTKYLKVVALLALLILPLGCGQEAGQEEEKMTRSEFEEAVIGKSQEEVIDAVGRPDNTSSGVRPRWSYWYYRRAARDEITGNLGKVQVVFKDGAVVQTNF